MGMILLFLVFFYAMANMLVVPILAVDLVRTKRRLVFLSMTVVVAAIAATAALYSIWQPMGEAHKVWAFDPVFRVIFGTHNWVLLLLAAVASGCELGIWFFKAGSSVFAMAARDGLLLAIPLAAITSWLFFHQLVSRLDLVWTY